MDKKQKGERKNEEKITGNSDCGLYDGLICGRNCGSVCCTGTEYRKKMK